MFKHRRGRATPEAPMLKHKFHENKITHMLKQRGGGDPGDEANLVSYGCRGVYCTIIKT